MSCSHLAVLLRWGTETSGWVPKSSSYTRHPLIGRQNRHFRATGGLKPKNTVPARYFWTTAKVCFIEENVAQKFDVLLAWPTLLLFVYCVTFFFVLGLNSRLHCVGLL